MAPLLGSSLPNSVPIVGGIYNEESPAPISGQPVPLQTDSEGNLLVNVAVGGGSGTVKIEDTNGNALNSNGAGALQVAVVSGGGSNPSVGTTGTTAPTSATEIGIVDINGNLQGASATNPVPVTVENSVPNNSIGLTGQTAPTSATEVGGINSLGQLAGIAVSPSGAILTQDGTPGDNSVLKEVLMEMRAIRKLLFLLYEESNEGAPTNILDDTDESNSVDYTN